jgi:hypothetical protein
MSIADVAVILGGITAIAWVNWYFFFAGSSSDEGKTYEDE